MATDTKTIKASCLCGGSAHSITIPSASFPLQGHFCHCNSCRHMSGALTLTVANLPASYKPAKELLDKLVPFQFSKRLTFYHCKTCGSQMLCHCLESADDASKGQYWDVTCGSLDQADGVFEVVAHEQVADTLDGGFSDFLKGTDKFIPRWPHHEGKGEQLPLYWNSPSRPQITPSPEDKLHCHCKCGGVNFWIARPSERSKNAINKSAWWLRDNGTKFLAGNCCCNSCRLDSGMEWINWTFIPIIDISLDTEGNEPYNVPFGTLKGYRSSPDVERYFCETCGATVFFTTDERENLIDVAVGLLDAQEGARAESWLEWRTQRLSFREDSIPRAEKLTLAVEKGLEEFGNRHQK